MKKLDKIFNKGPVPYEAKGFRWGFVILFAVTVSAILLSITLGVASIALKEIKFGTSAKDTNDAFFAADTGIECALMNDKGITSSFPLPSLVTPASISCGGVSIPVSFSGTATAGTYTFFVNSLGSSDVGCANVSVYKDGETSSPYIRTTLTSKGYNIGDQTGTCLSTNPDRVEREIITNY